MKYVATDKAAPAIGPYSQGVVSGELFYSSGQIPLTPSGEMVEGSIIDQSHQVFANLQAVLAKAGSSLDGVLKTTVFIKDMNDFAALNEVYASYFGSHKPARSTVEVARLPKDAKVEIEVIAKIEK